MRLPFLAATVALTAVNPAQARDWPDADGWSIGEGTEYCGMKQEYEGKGDTELLLLLGFDGDVVISVKNSDWSPIDGQKYDLEFYLNGTGYGGGSAVGDADEYKKGFISTFGSNFAQDFAGGSSLAIYRGDTLVDKLSLRGSAAGMAMVRRCVAALKADRDAAARERARFAHIADNPFAVEQTAEEKAKFGEPKPQPRTSPAAWLSDADYPSRAQREERAGTVGYSLDVAADGRVIGCQITKSSGHADLDEATCRLLPRRARFVGGNAFRYEGEQVWRLPQ